MYWLPSSKPQSDNAQGTLHMLVANFHTLGEHLARITVTVQHLETALSKLQPHFSSLGGVGFHASTAFHALSKTFDQVPGVTKSGGGGGGAFGLPGSNSKSLEDKQAAHFQNVLFKKLLDSKLTDVNISEAGQGSAEELRKLTAAMTEAQVQSAKIVKDAINSTPNVAEGAKKSPGAIPVNSDIEQVGKILPGSILEQTVKGKSVPLTPEEQARSLAARVQSQSVLFNNSNSQAYPFRSDGVPLGNPMSRGSSMPLLFPASMVPSQPPSAPGFPTIGNMIPQPKPTFFQGGISGKPAYASSSGIGEKLLVSFGTLAAVIPLVGDGFRMLLTTVEGFVKAASPDAWSTLTGSMELLSATIGRNLIPATLQASKILQDMRLFTDRKSMVGQATSNLIENTANKPFEIMNAVGNIAQGQFNSLPPGIIARAMGLNTNFFGGTANNQGLLTSANQFRAAPTYTGLDETYKRIQLNALGDDPITTELRNIQSNYLAEMLREAKGSNSFLGAIRDWAIGGQR